MFRVRSHKTEADTTILVTGATDGLGRALSVELARRGATVLLHGRSDMRLADTTRQITEATGIEPPRTYRADLSSVDDVRLLAERVLADQARLDILVNNAGIGPGPPGGSRELSADGYELRFAVNYLAPFLLTNLMLPLLRHSAPAGWRTSPPAPRSRSTSATSCSVAGTTGGAPTARASSRW